jgi:mono/diheme cytochrome c family protein
LLGVPLGRLSWPLVTEVPEHLLRRSRERRAALGLGGGEETSETPAAEAQPAAPATTGETTPAAAPSGPAPRQPAAAPAAPPPPKPDPPYVAAAKARPRIPVWALAALSLMPIWAFMYVRALTEPPEVATGPIGVGAEVYSNCASCHGASGEGSASGRQFSDGEVLKTFPHIEDQLRFVYFGTENYNIAGVDVYGNPDREGEVHQTGSLGPMPAWGADAGGGLTDAEILAVVCHERYTLGGAVSTDDEFVEEFENWCADEAPAYINLEEEGGTLADLDQAGLTNAEGDTIEIIDIGDEPMPGSPPG